MLDVFVLMRQSGIASDSLLQLRELAETPRASLLPTCVTGWNFCLWMTENNFGNIFHEFYYKN